MNKKAQIFVPLALIFTAIALFTIVNGAQYKYQGKKIGGIEPTIGMHASAIVKAYQEQEEVLLYLDNAAKLSLHKALTETAEKGGLTSLECGNSGYNLWNTDKTKTCFPKYEETFKESFTDILTEEVSDYNKVSIYSGHELAINQNDEELEVVGETDEKITLALTIGGSVIEKQTQKVSAEISVEIANKINQYHETFERASHLYKVEDAFLKAIVTQESGGDRYAISPTGCAGLAQFCHSTAKDYFKESNNLVIVGRVCVPKKNSKGQTYTYTCDSDTLRKDPRFNPEKSIFAQAKYLAEIINYEWMRDLTDYYAFTAAAYNGGPNVIKKAIKSTGKKDPSWEEVAAQINKEFLKKFSNYKSWSDDQRERKANEIKNYVNKVSAYYNAWGGADMFAPSVIGTFEFGQNFRTNTNYNLSIYEELKKFAEEAIKDCDDNVADCLEKKRKEFNEKNETEILYLSECEEGANKAYYDFLENLQDCAYSWGNNCKCKVTDEYTENETKKLKGNYKITFKEQNKIIPITSEPQLFFSINLTQPKEINSEFSIKDISFWAPTIYNFKYDDELENEQLVFHDSLSGKTYFMSSDFKNIFMIVKDNKFSLWMDYDKDFIQQVIESVKGIFNIAEDEHKNLMNPLKETAYIPNNCTVAKQTFRVCAKTKYKLPNIKERNNRKTLVYEESKIKFALTLIDNTPAAAVNDLKAERVENIIGTILDQTAVGMLFNDDIFISWEHEEVEDLVLYEVSFEDELLPLSKQTIDEFYKDKAKLLSEQMEKNTLYYEELPNNSRKYSIIIDSTEWNIQDEKNYIFTVVGIDNFQNKAPEVTVHLLAEENT